MHDRRILFLSHTFPPILGGVENQNYHLSEGLRKIASVSVIANTKGKWWLPVFLPIVLIRSLWIMRRKDFCLLGNGVLAPLGRILKWYYPSKKVFCVIHGLDITFAGKKGFLPLIYRRVNIPSLRALDRLFAVGTATIDEAAKVGITSERCTFIPNGVTPEFLRADVTRQDLSNILKRDTSDLFVLLRVGRFVPHKGTDWFIRTVMPALPAEVLFVATGYRVSKRTAGDHDNFEACQQAINQHHLANRVILLPTLEQEKLRTLLNTVDLVVSPNVPTAGSMEGFGINVIEAGACNRIVIAADLEGLADAIHDGKNGFLIPPGSASAWIKRINEIRALSPAQRQHLGTEAGQYVASHFTWDAICQQYLESMETTTL